MKYQLEASGLEKSYHGKKVVDDVSVKVRKGEIIGLLGPNGAGKTTTFSLILGLVPLDGGHVYLDEEEITHLPMYARARRGLCLLPQEPSAFRRLSVRDNLLSILEMNRDYTTFRTGTPDSILKDLGLFKLADAKAYTLSGGERRRLEIARALISEPEYMLLDEPFTGIDPLAIADLQELILSLRARGLGLLITDHSVRETLKITDRAYIIDKGRILKEGTPEDLVASFEVQQSYLGEGFNLD
jgi:lipopolysaccharide export system ATP-binding protein